MFETLLSTPGFSVLEIRIGPHWFAVHVGPEFMVPDVCWFVQLQFTEPPCLRLLFFDRRHFLLLTNGTCSDFL